MIMKMFLMQETFTGILSGLSRKDKNSTQVQIWTPISVCVLCNKVQD